MSLFRDVPLAIQPWRGELSPACAFSAACSGLSSCIRAELLQPRCLWAYLCSVLHFMSLWTPLQSPSQVFTPKRLFAYLHCGNQSGQVISKGQGSKLSITILLRVFIPIYSIGTAAMRGVPLGKKCPCDGDGQPQRRSSPALTACIKPGWIRSCLNSEEGAYSCPAELIISFHLR